MMSNIEERYRGVDVIDTGCSIGTELKHAPLRSMVQPFTRHYLRDKTRATFHFVAGQ